MLQPIEILSCSSRRRALRRAVKVECQVLSDFWDESVPLLARDLSEDGMWLESPFPQEVGDEIVVSFAPPRWRGPSLVALAEVRRADAHRRSRRAGMGLAFLDLRDDDRDDLAAALRGLPPPLPVTRSPAMREELAWIEMLLTWEEDLGDRVNVFEVSDAFEATLEDEIEIASLGELITSPRAARAGWRRAA